MGEAHSMSWLSKPGWIRILLLASIGLNLFFAGLTIGARLPPWGEPPGAGAPHRTFDHLRRALSEDGYKTVGRLMRDIEARRHQQFQATEPLRARLRTALTAQPFDREAFAKSLVDLNGEIARDRAALDSEIAEAIARLSVEDRRQLADFPLLPPPPHGGAGFAPNFLPPDRPPRP